MDRNGTSTQHNNNVSLYIAVFCSCDGVGDYYNEEHIIIYSTQLIKNQENLINKVHSAP